MSQSCFYDGELSYLDCTLEFQQGTLEWTGIGFECPHPSNTILNNKISLSLFSTCLPDRPQQGECGPYDATLSCHIGDENQTSVLMFIANYTLMNGNNISCGISLNPSAFFENRTLQVGGKKQ